MYNKMKKIYENGDKKLNAYLDFLEVVKLLQQFNKMKNINFDQNQKKIFDFTLKPRFFKKENKFTKTENSASDKVDKNSDVDYNEIYECYIKVKNMENINHINDKLLKMFDNDLKFPFQILHENEVQIHNKNQKIQSLCWRLY